MQPRFSSLKWDRDADKCFAACCRAIAQAPVSTVSCAINCVVVVHRAEVAVAPGDVGPVTAAADLVGAALTALGCAIGEAPVIVVTPRPEAAVAVDGVVAVAAQGQALPACAADQHRDISVISIIVVAVAAPTPELTIGLESAAVVARASLHVSPVAATANPCRGLEGSSVGAKTALALIIATPAPELAIGLDRAGVATAGGHRQPGAGADF